MQFFMLSMIATNDANNIIYNTLDMIECSVMMVTEF